MDTPLKPENKAMLTKVQTYHVVAGDCDSKKLRSMILVGNGKAELKTVEGWTLHFAMNGSTSIIMMDDKGGVVDIAIADVTQSNGVLQVVDLVPMPARWQPGFLRMDSSVGRPSLSY